MKPGMTRNPMPVFVVGIVVLAPFSGTAQEYTITTIAGGFDWDHRLGDGGPAAAAMIDANTLAVDAHGNLYIADNNRVRKVSPQGIISTVAGVAGGQGMSMDGGEGYSGDGGPATKARLDGVRGIAVDAKGNLYLSDGNNQRVRKVDTDGIITTLVGDGTYGYTLGEGGDATRATVRNPQGIAVDRSGNVFFSAADEGRVRRISPQGVITTVVGLRGGSCGWNGTGDGGPGRSACIFPFSLTLDSAGNIFIAEYNEGRVRKLSHNGIITTVAGGRIGTGVGSTAARRTKLDQVHGVAVDPAGNLFIAEVRRVRMVKPDGTIRTIAGSGEPGMTGDGGPAADALLESVTGIAADSTGRIYVADHWENGRGRIRLLTPSMPDEQRATSAGRDTGLPGLPAILGPSTAAGARRNPATIVDPEDLRRRAIDAIASNALKYRDLLYRNENWVEFRSPDGNTLFTSPRFQFHRELLENQHEPVKVFDGWADRGPLTDPFKERILDRQGGGARPD